jgi:hypothetical protein
MQKPIEIYTNVFKRFKELGYDIKKAIDVGAHQGSWAKRFKTVYPDAELYLVDGNEKHKEKLNEYGQFIHGYVNQKKKELFILQLKKWMNQVIHCIKKIQTLRLEKKKFIQHL